MTASSTRQLRLKNNCGLSSLSSGSVSMSNLPAEIWHIICSHVTRESLPSLRLTCHKLAHVAATSLFAEIYINWLPRSLCRLGAIAAHPKLRLLVKTLICEQCLLDEQYENFEKWRAVAHSTHVLSRLEDEEEEKAIEIDERIVRYRTAVSRHPLPPEEQHQKCLHHVVTTLLNDQESLLNDPGLLLALTHAVSKLVNLQRMQIGSGLQDVYPFDESDQPLFDSLRFENAACLLGYETFLRAPFFCYGDTETYRYPLQPLAFIFHAIQATAHALTALDVAALPFEYWDPGKPHGYWKYAMSVFDGAVLGQVRSLKLGLLNGREQGTIPPAHQQITHLIGRFRFVTSLRLKLQTLSAQSDMFAPGEDLWFGDCLTFWDLSDILDQLYLRHLQDLAIDRFRTTEAAFVSFMTKHAGKLRSISFSEPYMTSPGDHVTKIHSWKRALKEVAPVMSLKRVDLGCIKDSMILELLISTALIKREEKAPSPLRSTGRRHEAYCRSISAYLRASGNIGYPDF
ncbi:MAG: hypothetical protein Q9216_002426 [Gyalolechia sp. 2 TL-2023]